MRVLRISQIQNRFILPDANRNRCHLSGQRHLRNDAFINQLFARQPQRDKTARDRSAARAAVRLNDITIHGNLSLAQCLHIGHGAQRTSDQALNLRTSAVELELGNIAAVSRVGCARQHVIFRRDPALAGSLDMRRNIFLYRSIADNLCVAHANEHGAFCIHRIILYNLDFAHLIVAP